MARHLEQQAAKRHEDYQRAEIASLKKRLEEAESKIDSIMSGLSRIERNLGWPGK